MPFMPIIVSVLVVSFAGQTAAAGLLQFFFTSSSQPYGLTDPTLAFRPTLGNSQDAAHYQVAMFPPAAAVFQTPDINWHVGDFAYIWLRFTAVDTGHRIRGLGLDVDGIPAEIAYYVVDDLLGEQLDKRWEGAFTLPDAPEFKQDPLYLHAESAHGIVNQPGNGDNWNLYQGATRIALLGAIRYSSNGVRELTVTQLAPSPIPEPTIWWYSGAANWMPEPAAGVSLVSCALIARGRRTPCPGGTR